MSLKIEFDYGESYEYVSSLDVFLNKTNKYDLGKSWYNGVEAGMSEVVKASLEQENSLFLLSYLQMLIHYCPVKDDIVAFLKWLEEKSPGQIYELLATHLGEEIPNSFEEYRDHYVNLITSWKDSYEVNSSVNTLLRTEVRNRREASKDQDPIDIVEELTNGIRLHPDQRIQKIILVPSFHYRPLNRMFILKDIILIQYATELETGNSTLPSSTLVRRTKALADEKRLFILKLVANKPRTFTEISKATKLSKSNLHYHLTMLRTAGLIRINNYMLAQPDSYEVRADMFGSLKEELENYVFDK